MLPKTNLTLRGRNFSGSSFFTFFRKNESAAGRGGGSGIELINGFVDRGSGANELDMIENLDSGSGGMAPGASGGGGGILDIDWPNERED